LKAEKSKNENSLAGVYFQNFMPRVIFLKFCPPQGCYHKKQATFSTTFQQYYEIIASKHFQLATLMSNV
jgi:hypothetical protein